MSMCKIRFAPFFLLLLTLFLGGIHAARAEYYTYTDKSGAVCITNDRNAVPPKYRATMKVVNDAALEKKELATRLKDPLRDAPPPQAAGPVEERKDAAPAEPATTLGRLKARFPWAPPLLFAGTAVLLFFIIRKLSDLLPSSMLAKVIYLAFFLGVFVFAYKCYADQVVSNYFTVKARILALFEKANRREMPEKPGSAQSDNTPTGAVAR